MQRLLSIFLLFILCQIGLTTYSQTDSTTVQPESYEFLPERHGKKDWKLILGLDARRSFFRGVPVKINGLRIGAQFLGVHRFGIGFYGLSKNVVFTDIPVDNPAATDTSLIVFNAGYLSLFYERVIYRNKKWEFAVPLEYSAGSITGYFEDSTGTFLPLADEAFNALSFGIQTKYFVFKWLAPRFSIGYRFILNSSPEIKKAFNKPYYSFGLQILLGELYRTIKAKKIFTLKDERNELRLRSTFYF